MGLPTLQTFYSNNFYEFLLVHNLFESKSELLTALIKIISSNLKNVEKLDFNLTIPETSLVQFSQNDRSMLKQSNIKMKPDLMITFENIIVCPIEFELYFSTSNQTNQILTYFHYTYNLLMERFKNTPEKLGRYLQYTRSICIAFIVDEKIK